ncbi:MAG: hypothetical protein OXC95_08195 [Dehalococcoidia bacterium]|nr:hypothetical protein [Dehalococcoidia bacterium]
MLSHGNQSIERKYDIFISHAVDQLIYVGKATACIRTRLLRHLYNTDRLINPCLYAKIGRHGIFDERTARFSCVVLSLRDEEIGQIESRLMVARMQQAGQVIGNLVRIHPEQRDEHLCVATIVPFHVTKYSDMFDGGHVKWCVNEVRLNSDNHSCR